MRTVPGGQDAGQDVGSGVMSIMQPCASAPIVSESPEWVGEMPHVRSLGAVRPALADESGEQYKTR